MESHFIVQPPSPVLDRAVHELWDFQRPGDGAWHSGAPKPFVEIVFNLDAPFDWRARPDGPCCQFHRGWITPLQFGPRQARPHRDIRLVGARLYPAAALANFGPLPPGDGTPPVECDVADGWFAATHALLSATADAIGRLAILDTAMVQRLADSPSALLPDPEVADVATLSARLECNERDLRRRFARDMGISPKRWLRLARLDRVLRDPDLNNPAVTIASIAHRHDFADQAHLAREFRLLIGQPADGLRSSVRTDHSAPPHFLG